MFLRPNELLPDDWPRSLSERVDAACAGIWISVDEHWLLPAGAKDQRGRPLMASR
jgi:hypothetical protein